jgi:hypothetical protein
LTLLLPDLKALLRDLSMLQLNLALPLLNLLLLFFDCISPEYEPDLATGG